MVCLLPLKFIPGQSYPGHPGYPGQSCRRYAIQNLPVCDSEFQPEFYTCVL